MSGGADRPAGTSGTRAAAPRKRGRHPNGAHGASGAPRRPAETAARAVDRRGRPGGGGGASGDAAAAGRPEGRPAAGRTGPWIAVGLVGGRARPRPGHPGRHRRPLPRPPRRGVLPARHAAGGVGRPLRRGRPGRPAPLRPRAGHPRSRPVVLRPGPGPARPRRTAPPGPGDGPGQGPTRRRPGGVRGAGCPAVGRAGAERTAGDGREQAAVRRLEHPRPERPEAGDRPPRRLRTHQQADRRTAVPLAPDRRRAPVPDLRAARHHLPHHAARRPRARAGAGRRTAGPRGDRPFRVRASRPRGGTRPAGRPRSARRRDRRPVRRR